MSDIVKQLRDNAAVLLAPGTAIPTGAIAGALQMAADEIERQRALILWADDISYSCCNCLRYPRGSDQSKYEEWKRTVERLEPGYSSNEPPHEYRSLLEIVVKEVNGRGLSEETVQAIELALQEANAPRSSPPPPAECADCEGSGESTVYHDDGTVSSTATPPCAICGGSGMADLGIEDVNRYAQLLRLVPAGEKIDALMVPTLLAQLQAARATLTKISEQS